MYSVPHNDRSRAISPWFNIFFTCFSLFIIGLLIHHRMNIFKTDDVRADLTVLTPQETHSYSLTQTAVEVGLHIKNMPEFNVKKGLFSFDAIVWFSFDPRIVSVARIGKFTFEQAVIHKKNKLGSQLQHDGTLLVYYEVNASFSMPLNFESFPFDNHVLDFIITNPFFTPGEIIFNSSRKNFTVAPHFEVEEWTYVDKNVRTGYLENTLNPQQKNNGKIYDPRAIFSMSYQRTGMRYIISIILPLILLFFISLFSFNFDPRKEQKTDIITLVVTLLTGIIGYRYIIENLSPEVGYFMISDYIFLFLLVCLAIVLAFNIFFERTTNREKKIITCLLHGALIVLFVYLLNPWK